MKIWIVNPYGALPSEGWREYRSFMLAKALAARGHEVTWWISDFIHRSKTHRARGDISDPLLPPGIRVVGVHSTPYSRNISWERIQYEKSYGKEFLCLAVKEVAPDLIVMGDPALFFGSYILTFREKARCKMVLDVIDLWPELFAVALPKWLRPVSHFIFYPLFLRRRKLVESCDGVVAVSRDYLNTSLAGQDKKKPNTVVYWGIDTKSHNTAVVNSILDNELQAFRARFVLTAVYAGTLGDAYDMNIIIAAIKQSKAQNLPIGFIVAGDGPRKQSFADMTGPYASHLKFVGALPASDMTTLYSNSDVGLMTYAVGSTVAMPIKFFDYLVGGLAILNSLDRDVRAVIQEHGVGLNYHPSDIQDLIHKLKHLAQNPQELSILKERAKKLVTDYEAPMQYEQYSIYLEQFTKNREVIR